MHSQNFSPSLVTLGVPSLLSIKGTFIKYSDLWNCGEPCQVGWWFPLLQEVPPTQFQSMQFLEAQFLLQTLSLMGPATAPPKNL